MGVMVIQAVLASSCLLAAYLGLNLRDDAYESAWERREEEMLVKQKMDGGVFYRNMTDICVLDLSCAACPCIDSAFCRTPHRQRIQPSPCAHQNQR
jgi:hypothetical protein